jgi:hypothetical protein
MGRKDRRIPSHASLELLKAFGAPLWPCPGFGHYLMIYKSVAATGYDKSSSMAG